MSKIRLHFVIVSLMALVSYRAIAETVIPMHTDGIWDIATSSDGKWLATAGGDGILKIWDAATLTLKTTIVQNDRKFQLYDANFLTDNNRIIATQLGGAPIIWDIASGKKLASLDGHTKMVSRAAQSPDGKLIYTAGADYKVIAWDSQTYEQLGQINFKSPVGLAPQKAYGVTVVAGLDGIIMTNVLKDEVLKPITREERFTTLVRTADNSTFVVGSIKGNASPKRIDLDTGDLIDTFTGVESNWGWNIAATPANNSHDALLAVAYYQGPTAVWNQKSKKMVFNSIHENWQSLSVGFSPLGNQIFVGDTKGNLHIFDTPTAKEIH